MSAFRVVADGSTSPSLDGQEARRAMGIIMGPGARHELRALDPFRSAIASADDLDAATRAARDLSSSRSLYITLNPIRPDLAGKSAADRDVTSRRWLPIDIDPVKADPDASATEAEKEAARSLAWRLADSLFARGWPEPVVIDSGNGYWLLYRIDLPNDALAKQWVSGCLKALAKEHDAPGARIDAKIHNASRIMKLPGSWARKGADTADRPHRPCTLHYVPGSVEVVPAHLIKALAGPAKGDPAPPPPPPGPESPWVARASDGRADAYARSAVEKELMRLAMASAGERNNTLNEAAFNLGTLIAPYQLDRNALLAQLEAAALRLGLGALEVGKTIRSGLAAGEARPRARVEPGGAGKPPGASHADVAGDPGEPRRPVTFTADTVEPRPVTWVWPGRVPVGKLTTFAGWGGLGKSFVSLDIAARVTRGDAWPDSDGECAEAGSVLIVNCEDEVDDTIVPRLMEMGADMARVRFLVPEVEDTFSLADLPTLEYAAEDAGDLRLIIIDPAPAFVAGKDDHKNSELRSLLRPLGRLAAKLKVGIIMITHVSKPSGAKGVAAARVIGSVAWVNAVRSACMFNADPDDPLDERRLLLSIKVNNGPKPKGLSYRVVKTDTLARVEWIGQVDATADDVCHREGGHKADEPNRAERAGDWLAARFAERPEWTSDELCEMGRAAGISRNAIFEAKKQLGIRARKGYDADAGKVEWRWVLPDGEAPF